MKNNHIQPTKRLTIQSIHRFLKLRIYPTPGNAVLSLIIGVLMIWAVGNFLNWALIRAVWVAGSSQEARSDGATWAFIGAKIQFFLFGFYPKAQLWRPIGAFILIGLTLVPFVLKFFQGKKVWVFLSLFVLWPIILWVVVQGGGIFPRVSTNEWGGLMLTLILSLLGLLFSFPLGLVLALGRRSPMPVVRAVSVSVIEFFRGVPLITILFMSSVVVPFFLPPGIEIDKMFRVVLGMTLFQSAYLAEVIRGGLQAIPLGQYEAADSLGLRYWQVQYLVILPQALRITISNIGGISISFIKDTSLVLIIGLFDLLGIVRPLVNDPQWLGMEPEGLLFAGFVFWIICFGISRLTYIVEERVNRLPLGIKAESKEELEV